jgi:hypothetical protein
MAYSSQFVTTPMEGRFAFCYLGMKRTTDMNNQPLGDRARYECSFYFPKIGADRNADPNYQFFARLVWDVVTNEYRGTWPMINAQTGAWDEWPIDDCDVPAVAEKYPWARGMWKVRLSGGSFQPRVFDLGNNPIRPGVDGKYRQDQFKGDDAMGGDWGQASVNAFPWAFGNRRGVSFGLEGIKVTRQDTNVGGAAGRPVEQMFGAPTGQPVHGGAAPQAAPPLPGGYAPPAAPQPYGQPPAPGYGAPAVPPTQPGYAPPAASPTATPYSPASQQPSAGYPPAPGPAGTAPGAYPSNQGYAPPHPAAVAPPAGYLAASYGAPPAPGYAPQPQGGMPPAPPQIGQR